ncbi:hypothetical protein FQN50_008085 [Emmonsiellopsis sp. PD_5]|nr:hypothetical protein FQN50_008085 [Emmonsiellopsis sp. PD_5]
MASEQPNPPPPGEVNLDLDYVFLQLHHQAAITLEEVPHLTNLPRHGTRIEVCRQIADDLAAQNDTATVLLRTKEERALSRQRARRLPVLSRPQLQGPLTVSPTLPHFRPIIRDPDRPDVPPLRSPQSSPRARSKARRQFEEFKQRGNVTDDLYHFVIWPLTFQTRLASVNASMELALIDAEPDIPSATLHNVPCLWDTGAQITMVTDDILPPEFLQHLKSDQYLDRYALGSDSSVAVQISMMLQFSNTIHNFDIIASVVPAGRLVNGLSGILLGQHSLIDSLDCKLTPARVLRAQGMSVTDGHWGRIELAGCIVDDQYKAL